MNCNFLWGFYDGYGRRGRLLLPCVVRATVLFSFFFSPGGYLVFPSTTHTLITAEHDAIASLSKHNALISYVCCNVNGSFQNQRTFLNIQTLNNETFILTFSVVYLRKTGRKSSKQCICQAQASMVHLIRCFICGFSAVLNGFKCRNPLKKGLLTS